MVIYRKLTDLEKLQWNPRTIKKEDMDRLIQSIKSFWVIEWRPFLLSNRTGKLVIIWGNQRYEACKKLWIKEVPTHLIEWLTEEQEKEIIIRDNVSNGEWDMDLLANEWDTQSLIDWWVDINFETVEPIAEEDDFDEAPPANPITVLGDLYEIWEHRLLCGDSTQTDTFEKLMQGEMADMVVTDPPYNVAYEGKTKDALTIENDSMNNDEFYKFLYDFYSALSTAVKKGGAIYVWHAPSEIINFAKAMVDAGWLLKQQVIWIKNTMVLWRQDYQWKHEPCLYGWLDGGSHNWYSDRKQTTLIEWDKPLRNGEHPTMKPIGLFSYQIQNSSKKGDIVIDAFGGSGTTMVACEQINRKSRLVEFDPKYCDVIVKRMIRLDPTLEIKRNWQIYNTTH